MIQPGGHETIYHGHDEPKSHYSRGRGKKERERGRREIEREKEVVYTLQTFFCAENLLLSYMNACMKPLLLRGCWLAGRAPLYMNEHSFAAASHFFLMWG